MISLTSRTHFEVLGLGLKAYKSSKMSCFRLEDSTFFDLLKMGHGHDLFSLCLGNQLKSRRKFGKTFFFFGGRQKKNWGTIFLEDTSALCLWSLALALRIPVLGLERVCSREIGPWYSYGFLLCPWPWPRRLCPRLHLCKIKPFWQIFKSVFKICVYYSLDWFTIYC